MERYSKNRILIPLVCFVFLLILNGTATANSEWWDSNYGYRQQLTVGNNVGFVLESGYTIGVSLDISGLSGVGKAKANGDDIRIVYWNGATYEELDRILDIGAGKAAFMTQGDISANGTDANYWVYYGRPSSGTPPDNASNVFQIYDTFTRADNGMLGFTEGGNYPWHEYIQSYFQLSSGKLYSGTDTSDIVASISAAGDDNVYTASDLSFETKVRIGASPNELYWTSIHIRKSAASDYVIQSGYSALIRKNGELLLYESGGYINSINLGAIDWSIEHTLRFDAYGTSLKVYWDGVEKLTAIDDTYTSGYISITKVAETEVWHDDIKVRKYIYPEPTTSLGGEEGGVTLEDRVAVLEGKIDILNATNQNQSAIIQEQETKIELLNATAQEQETKMGLIESTLNTLKDFVKKIYDTLSKKKQKDIGPWPF